MSGTAYIPISDPSQPTDSELCSITTVQDEKLPGKIKDFALGMPCSKPVFNVVDICTLLCTLACLVASICVVTPKLNFAWRLKFDVQIVIIGFLLSVMNQCFRRIAPMVFLILEARWGRSSLQNYDAILRNSLSISQTNLLWKIIILTLIILPLGLSAAYKSFTGGHSSVIITSSFPRRYGLTIPPLDAYSTMNNSI